MNTQFDLVICNGLVVTGQGITRHDIAVQGEAIAVTASTLEGKAERVIDATGKLVLPGIIDVHTHPIYLDDMRALSEAAAYGGTTTLIHHAFAKSGMELIATLERFRAEGEQHSILDFGLHGGIFEAQKQAPDIPKAFDLGVTSFKFFMTYAELGWMTDDYWLMAAMDLVAEHGGLVMVHAECGLCTHYLQQKYLKLGIDPVEAFVSTRPAVLEAEAVYRAICMAQVTGCPVYFPHVTAAKAVEIIARAQAEGQVVYAETCPQYLTLTEDEVLRRRALAKVGPPLRTTEDIAALWAGLVHGVINVIASDHAPKAKRRDDEFFVAPYGSPQAETMLAVVYDAGINGGYITLPQLVQVLCENPAKIFGLYPKKGTLQVGSDADLVIFDPNRVHTISQSTQHSHASYTLYEGRECLGMPILVMQRGHILVEDGQLLGRSGQGQFLRTRIEGRFPLTSEHDDGK